MSDRERERKTEKEERKGDRERGVCISILLHFPHVRMG